MTPRVTIVGSLNMDLVVRAPRFPQPGETLIGTDFNTVPGGKGANQGVAAGRLGAHVSMIGRVGCDDYAETLLHNLAASGVDHTFVTRDAQHATGVALIVVDDAGQNSIVVASGANSHLSPADVETAAATIGDADALILQLESPLETVTCAAQMAHAHGVTVILNPAPARALPSSLLSLVDFLIPNETEAALLTGMPVGDQTELEAVATRLSAQGVGTVILTLGDHGALLARERETRRVPAFKVTPIDTTAAGDAFVAGFAVASADGQPLDEAVRWGNAAGALAASRFGAQPSLPTRQEVERLLTQGID
jgi:ribokinase